VRTLGVLFHFRFWRASESHTSAHHPLHTRTLLCLGARTLKSISSVQVLHIPSIFIFDITNLQIAK
jgi:hypothetical protein